MITISTAGVDVWLSRFVATMNPKPFYTTVITSNTYEIVARVCFNVVRVDRVSKSVCTISKRFVISEIPISCTNALISFSSVKTMDEKMVLKNCIVLTYLFLLRTRV